MSTPSEPRLEDDASGEAWFQKGVTLLEGRKREREIEEKLRRRMAHSVMYEMHFWLGVMWILMLFFNAGQPGNELINYLSVICAAVFFAAAIDGAAAKRSLAILEWIEHQKASEPHPGKNSRAC